MCAMDSAVLWRTFTLSEIPTERI
uniref:Uncharacterized protein n=1 Tax=Anguilla anguilla TaxID=7936 RepID=A0A0E9RKR8_ANGAN